MIRRNHQRRPEFDSLESVELLSGIGTPVDPSHAPHLLAQRGPQAQLALSGTVQGSYRILGGSEARFAGRGNIAPVGNVRLQGTVASASGGQLNLNLGRRGRIIVDVIGQVPGGGYAYQIAGGTRSFAADSGGGVAIPSLAPTGIRGGHFTLTLVGSGPTI